MAIACVIHSEQDFDFVEKTLVRPLPCNGFDQWISSQLLDARANALTAEIVSKCRAIIAVISRASLKSSRVRGETTLALKGGRTVIGVRTAPIEAKELPAEYSSLVMVDFTTESEANARRALAELLPSPDPGAEENGLSRIARRIEWNEEIFSESLAEALGRHGQSRAESLVARFERHLHRRPYPFPVSHAVRDLSVLRKQRQFGLMRRYAVGVLQSGTIDETVRRLYAQALIEEKAFNKALEVLAAIVNDPKAKQSEVFEAKGLIGRAFKQQYVDAPDAPGADELLRCAIDAYESVFKEDPTQLWHGINAASCTLRGHRDGIEGANPERAKQIAQKVLEQIDRLEQQGELPVWDSATKVEALLALDEYDAAGQALETYICHPDMGAFEVSSTYRQFNELLELGRNERGRPILDRLWQAVEQYRAGGFSLRAPATSDAPSASQEKAMRPLLIRVADPRWEPKKKVADLQVHARLGTIVSAEGSDASVKQLLEDPQVISIEESSTVAVSDCDKSVPFIRVADSYSGPQGDYKEKGDAALIAIIDDGIDVLHETFLDAHGASRIMGIWDQRDSTGPAPAPFTSGTFHSAENIAIYVNAQSVPPGLGRDRDGHGTHVASIAAGRRVGNFAGGVAPEAKILIVIPSSRASIGYSSSHLQALAFIDATATQLELPVVVNVSQGMNAGAHDGKSALEIAFDEFSGGGRKPGRVIVKSAGNERGKDGHAKIIIPPQSQEELRWRRDAKAKSSEHLELWWSSAIKLEARLGDPAGDWSDWVGVSRPKLSGNIAGGKFTMLFTKRHVDNGDSQLKIDLSDGNWALRPGLWRLEIRSNEERDQGEIHAWIERDSIPSSFVNHSNEDITLSIPGTAQSVITVGAVEVSQPIRLAGFSSYGPTRDGRCKPDVAAPGVDVFAARGGTAQEVRADSGTSMAAPHVTGAVALLLSRAAKSPEQDVIPAASQVASALRQKTRNYSSSWSPGQGFGVIDVTAFLAAF